MSKDERPPAVVAELGRPETPEETAARKARDSQNHRTRQTVNNLVLSLLATLAAVIVIVLMVPRADAPTMPNVDYAAIAAEGQGTEPDPLVTPDLSKAWHCNSAELRTKTADGVDSWYIGLLSPDQQYVGITQGFDANASWLSDQVYRARSTQTSVIGGVRWKVYDNRQSDADVGNAEYALVASAGHSTYVVFGTAHPKQIGAAAGAIAQQILAAKKSGDT
ncbi:DUF4245 domain-containing protein [Microbacterium sp. STN6]|uniref:DUF4245 domain-containing protein n=1 Tax=Microbacterium sp. STN6 TaxID=2995588 RepID=UPI002260AD09|nr:DUF4245 domain-containing protein [Microbacterium sp. STN6]MCX7521871.1 DUF4245 domain-containing protein [Microbacterium sp. STN6]